MIKFIKKPKLKFITSLFCSFAMALFVIISFSCKTYAYTIDNNGNLVGDNILNSNNFNGYSTSTFTCTYSNGIFTFNGYTETPIGETIGIVNIESGTGFTGQMFYSGGSINNGGIELTWSSSNNDFYIDFTRDNTNYNQNIARYNGTSATLISLRFYIGSGSFNNYKVQLSTTIGNNTLDTWEPYGIWYSQTNYDTIENLYDNTLVQYNDLALGNNYGYWKYIEYVEFEESNNIIFVPNTQEQNEWSITDLTTYNILKAGGYFDTTPLTMAPYQSNYNEVDTHISFKGFTPSDSLIITFNHSNGAQVVIYDENSNSFNYTISDANSLIDIDINIIRQSVPNFGLYIIDMYIRPNNAEQNGIYFANNDYITAYNKGYNVATSNADRKYIPQITDLQNQINSLNNNVIELSNNINTLKALNTDLQNQITNSTSWQNLFFAFADTPFKVVSNVLGFELFGLNLFSTFIGMITVFGVVYLLKKFL